MKKLKRQFGTKFVEMLKKSPTLLKDLEEIRANNVTIRQLPGRCQAYYNRNNKTIYLGSRCSVAYKIISLGHEFVHALLRPTTDPILGVTGRKEFIARCLSEEAEAIVHELKVQDELKEAGIDLTYGRTREPFNEDWVNCYHKYGRSGIRRKLKNTFTSTTSEKYPAYYGGWYDENIPESHRLP